MANHDLTYGLIAIAISVFFLIGSLDMLQGAFFSRELSALIAYILIAIGTYTVAKAK